MKTIKLLFFCIPFLLFSCKKNKESTDSNADYSEYLSAYTRGVITDDQSIIFTLNDEFDIDENNLENAISFEPKANFTAQYSKYSNSIVINSDNLERESEYKVSLDLNKLIGKGGKISTSLKIQGQYVTVSKKGLSFDKSGNKYLELAIMTAFPEKPDALKKMFDIAESDVKITKVDDTHYYALIKYNGNGDLKVKWNAKNLKSKNDGEIVYNASDLKKFKVLSTYHDKNKNTLTAYFSQNIKKKQDLTGHIKIGKKNAKYTVEGNKIIVKIGAVNQESADITFKKGMLSTKGIKTSKDYVYGISIELVKPALQWLAGGTYIPASGKFKIPFKAKGLKAVKVAIAKIPNSTAGQFVAWNRIDNMEQYELIRYGDFVLEKDIDLTKYASNLNNWNEFGIDMAPYFKREPGAIYKIYLSFNPSQTTLVCDNKELELYESNTLKQKWFDRASRYYDYYYNYNYKDRDNPCTTSFYSYLDPLIKNIHCTNVFPIIKRGENKVVVAVKELETNKLSNGAKVTLLNLQGRKIQSKSTGKGGIVEFENVDRPTKAVKIEYKNFITYYDLDDGEENSYTEFDISSNVSTSGNKLFVYSDRDVRRPGDSIYVNVMLNDVDFDFPEKLPVKVELFNPKNVLVNSSYQAIQKGKRIYSFAFPTSLEAPTGYWNADINVGPTNTRFDVRVETIKPNVVDATFNLTGQEKQWVYADELEGQVNVKYLAGFGMKNGKVTGNANIYPVSSPFSEYRNYRFSKYNTDVARDVALFEGQSSNNGNVSVSSDVDFKEFGGVSRVSLDTKIDLPGGGNNAMSSSLMVSPFESYVGIQKVRGRGWRGSFRYGETPEIPLIHLDKKGKPSSGKINIQVYKAKEDWWYDRYRLSNNYEVKTSRYYENVDDYTMNMGGKGKNTFRHKKDYGSGLFILLVEDLNSGHSAEYKYHAVTTNNYNVEGNPIFLQLEFEKTNFDIGETMDVKLPEIKNAKALVSIEKGNDIIESFWMDLNNPKLELKVKESYYPNFFLNVSIVQKYGNKENDRPMRMYSVEKIKVNERAQKLIPEIKAPKKVEPNQTFTFEVKEKKGQPIEYTVAVVDVGLLNITGYSTPNPLAHFSKQFPLLVKTWDIYDDLIFYLDPSFSGVFSIGGDGANKKMDEAAGFNRFKPVVYHLGPFKIGKNGRKKHSIALPNYIGNLKVMVVATNAETFGSTDEYIRVASPLMVQSQLPRALNISDEITLPVTLFKDEKSIKNANIKATSDNNALSFVDNDINVNLTDKQGLGELKFKVNEIAGKTTIGINAQSGRYKSNEETAIFVNYPNSYEDKTTYIEIPKGASQTIDINAFGYTNTKNVTLCLSGLILPDFSKYYSELIGYPHGCLEQTASKGLCLLYTDKMIEITPEQKAQSEQFLDAALDKITRYQKSDGSFKYWEGGYYHSWANLYAGHFLLEAAEHDIEINSSTLKNWLHHTASKAESWSLSGVSSDYLTQNEEMIQAYRLFLLAKANAPEKSAMNRFRKRELSPMAQVLLGGAYHYSGMKDVANTLLDKGLTNSNGFGYSYSTFGSDIRNRAINLMVLSIMRKGDSVDRYYKSLVKDLNSDSWLSTQEKGWALLACRYYFKDKNAKGNQLVKYDIKSQTHSQTKQLENNSYENYYWNKSQMGQQATVKNIGESNLFVVKNERAISKDLYPTPQNNNINLDVRYTDLNGNPISITDMKQGQEIMITTMIKNTDINDYQSLAMSLKMPSGWELQNPRLLGTATLKNDTYQYQDYRDDKVYTYFGVEKGKSKTFRFRAIANLKGDFYMPAVKVEHMYMGSVNASTDARRVNIR